MHRFNRAVDTALLEMRRFALSIRKANDTIHRMDAERILENARTEVHNPYSNAFTPLPNSLMKVTFQYTPAGLEELERLARLVPVDQLHHQRLKNVPFHAWYVIGKIDPLFRTYPLYRVIHFPEEQSSTMLVRVYDEDPFPEGLALAHARRITLSKQPVSFEDLNEQLFSKYSRLRKITAVTAFVPDSIAP